MEHKPCKHRKRETREGVTMDWCYAIGCCERGDMPCEYCRDRRDDFKKPENGKTKKQKAKKGTKKRHG